MFCLSPESGFVAKQWVGEESKSPESRVNAGYSGWTLETGVRLGMTPETGVGVGMMPETGIGWG